ncbi:MAG: Urease accessory protein UreD [Pseudonocardiales bacterium]|nr:Urease accessory protein UreD [Pseudonocardiales bacterium]
MLDLPVARPSRAIRARTSAVIETGGVLRELRCEPPLTLRRVYGDADECALCLVGTAAGPLPGDDLVLSLDVGLDARASLTSAGASIALGRPGGRVARLRTDAGIAPGGWLRAAPPPLIVTSGAHLETTVSIRLAAGAFVHWQEMVVLGRAGETGGSLRMRWDVTCDGLPLLRQTIDLADPALADWPVMLHRGRVLATVLLAGPQVPARTIVASPRATAARLAEDAVLITVLDDDAQSAQSQVDELVAQLLG